MRGEHGWVDYDETHHTGSSPHARGTQVLLDLMEFDTGIIPACAGNTMSVTTIPSKIWDHPRMRGEHIRKNTKNDTPKGSSPHARGTLQLNIKLCGIGGIIPACAGNTGIRSIVRRITRDHPRMRGEHSTLKVFLDAILGSSPHARGTPTIRPLAGKGDGIIPACAGNTCRLHVRC